MSEVARLEDLDEYIVSGIALVKYYGLLHPKLEFHSGSCDPFTQRKHFGIVFLAKNFG